MAALGSQCGQRQESSMAGTLKCSNICLDLEMSRIYPRLRRDTVINEETESVPEARRQMASRGQQSVVSQAAEKGHWDLTEVIWGVVGYRRWKVRPSKDDPSIVPVMAIKQRAQMPFNCRTSWLE